MKTMKGIFAAAALLLAAPALADDPVIPADEFVFCTVCHGIQVGGNVVIQAPRLSGMEDWYAVRQLEAFKKGWRGSHPDDTYGQEMRPMAEDLTADEIARVAAYVNAVDSAPPAVTVEGDATRGESLYATCVACHGADAGGNEALGGPALTGLNDWYLLTQLQNFKAGIRGSASGDTWGQQMRAATALLPDEQAMRDVVRYIATLEQE